MLLKELVQKGLLNVPTLTAAQLAKRHNLSTKEIETAVKLGMQHEAEHTDRKDLQREIALDHLKEDPKYYDKLDKAMPKEKVDEGMGAVDQVRAAGAQQSKPRLKYSVLFMKNKDTLNRIARALDHHSKQDRDRDLWGQIGDMAHIGEELENILNFLTHK
jgi:hypothetical protein